MTSPRNTGLFGSTQFTEDLDTPRISDSSSVSTVSLSELGYEAPPIEYPDKFPETMLVLSLDCDGCFTHSRYWKLRNEHLDEYKHDLLLKKENTPIIEANTGFRDHFKELIGEKKYQSIVFKYFTNRQSRNKDVVNAKNNNTDLFIPALPRLVAAISKENKVNCITDSSSLTDLYENNEPGDHFKKAMKLFTKLESSQKTLWNYDKNKLKFTEFVFDESKFSLLYAQIHELAKNNKNVNIVIKCYDNLGCLLLDLHDIFDNCPELIPDNVAVHFYKYEGKKVKFLSGVKGTGKSFDEHYAEHVKKMVEMATGLTIKECLENPKPIDLAKWFYFRLDTLRNIVGSSTKRETEAQPSSPLKDCIRQGSTVFTPPPSLDSTPLTEKNLRVHDMRNLTGLSRT